MAPEVQQQRTTYYDTPNHVLDKNGLSLRVRESGDACIQTLKSSGQGPMAGRGEWEWPIETDAPQLTLLADTPAGNLLRPTAIMEPVTVTEICRVTRKLLLESGTIVEAAIDEGRIRAGDADKPVHELELELKDGPIGPLYRLALELHADLPLGLEVESSSGNAAEQRGQDAWVAREATRNVAAWLASKCNKEGAIVAHHSANFPQH
jgi:inorganic triphosphatase YgiF